MKTLYKKLTAYVLGGALALSGAFLVVPMEGEHKKNGWHETYLDVVGIPTACLLTCLSFGDKLHTLTST